MAAPRIRHTQSKSETEAIRDDFMTQGYEVISEGDLSVLMRKKSWGSLVGHIVVALLTVWWTFGLGNVVYAIAAHLTAEQVMIKQDTAPTTA